jgi:quinol monooxygenase YgiN
MTVRPDAVDDFLDCFDDRAPRIRAFSGCRHLELWGDTKASAVFTACSHWTDPAALSEYRDSELFARTWAAVRPLFSAPPRAHRYRVVRPAGEFARQTGRPSQRSD